MLCDMAGMLDDEIANIERALGDLRGLGTALAPAQQRAVAVTTGRLERALAEATESLAAYSYTVPAGIYPGPSEPRGLGL